MFERYYQLKNMKVKKPISYTPVIVFLVIFLIYQACDFTNFNFLVIFNKAPAKIINFFTRMFPVNFKYYSQIWIPVSQTLAMSFLGTIIGAILAFPTMYFASSNLNSNKIALGFIRLILSIIRTIPITVYALFFSFIFNLGSFVGMLAIGIFTYSILTKMMYDYIETVDMKAFEALMATGCKKFKAYYLAILPQVYSVFLSQILYNLEMNIRSSAVLGYVGAGGIGLILNHQINLQNYINVTPILSILLLTVLIVEFCSRTLRKRLL